MAKYVDGFVLVVPRDKTEEYKKMASEGRDLWMKHGALEYYECMGDDLVPQEMGDEKARAFPEMAGAKDGEEVWFSFIVFKDKTHRDEVNKKVMDEMNEKYKDPTNMPPMPFDMKRMTYGGFKAEVERLAMSIQQTQDKQKIVPCLWFDANCEEAINFYVSLFDNSRIVSIKRYEEGMGTPGIEQMVGKVLTGVFELSGYRFMALDGGPLFKFNPSISLILNFDPSKDDKALEKIEKFWEKLSEGGKVLMEFQKYPFAEKYGWCEDKFGVSWQLMLTDPAGEERPFIIPSFLFVNEMVGKAEEAVKFYTSVFKDSIIGMVARYPKGADPDKEGTVMFSDFMLEGQWFAAMDSAREHQFSFGGQAISFEVTCVDQEEVDYYWEKLTTSPEFEQCGWLKDKYGVSWQIVPRRLGELLENDPDNKVLNAMLEMKKLDIKTLENAAK